MNCHCKQHDSNTLAHLVQSVSDPDMASFSALQDWLARQRERQTDSTSATTAPPEPSQIRSAAELCHLCHIRLQPAARKLMDDHDTPQQFYQKLLQHNCLADARRVLAHTLPKRRAIWWGCLVASDVKAHKSRSEIDQILPDVVQFVLQPTEENRRIVMEMGKRVGVNTLAGSLAMAVFFSGGSVSLPHLPAVAPRPFVTGRLVGVTIYLASVTRDAAKYKKHLRDYLHLGEQIARGQLSWQPRTGIQRDVALRCDELHEPAIGGPHTVNVGEQAEPAEWSREPS